MKKVDWGITMIDHTQAKAMGKLSNVLCQVGVTTIITKFIIVDIPIDRDAPILVGRGFLCTMGSLHNTLERIFSTFDGVCHQTFRAARFDVLRTAESDTDDEEEYVIKINKFGALIYGPRPAPYLNCASPEDRTSAIQATSGTHDGEAGSSRSKRSRNETLEELLLPQVHHEFLLWEGCTRDAKSRYNTRLSQLLPRHIYSPCIVNWDVLNQMGCDGEIDDMLRNRVREAESEEEIFTSEPNFEGDPQNDHLWYVSRRLGRQVQKNDLWLLSMFDARHQNGYANVAWVIAKWMKRKRAGTQKESQICCGQFISKLARKCRVLTEDVVRSLSAPIYCTDLDTTTLRDLIDSNGKLIPEDPQPSVPREGIPRPLRASMEDLYDRMGRMEIRQDAIERMDYRQS
ncbi:hypothetical protein Tco_0652007 [Tanacetum coccineum]|uniref:Uncharacterized protein n=1 Tax=Tanacetum coccineum TaxID=301880 RepID=A0ABQ4WWD4_9ASTR